MEINDLQLNLADLYIQLGNYQHAAQIIASIGLLTFQSVVGIIKLALAKVCYTIKCYHLLGKF